MRLFRICGTWSRSPDDGSLFDLRHDDADNIVAAVLANTTAHKAEAIGKGLLEGAKRKRQKPAG